ncbi:MAG: winged helix-turn-helix domain-containing protein [Candidatus Bathyarchaeia archaeon]
MSLEEKLREMDPDTSAFKIVFYLAFKESPMQPVEISRSLGEKGSTVRARLAELKRDGIVESTPEGYVSVPNVYDVVMRLYRGLEERMEDR